MIKKICALFFLIYFCFSPFVLMAQKLPPERSLAIENVCLIDAVNPSPQPNKTVLIVGNRIKAIGEKGKVSIPKGATIINGEGKYLIPGLWDAHVHLNSGKTFLPLFVANGITCVREMGGDLEQVKRLREQIAKGELLGPRIKMAGTIIESEKWLNWATNLARKDNDAGALEKLSKRIGVTTPEQGREAVRKLAAAGVDLIKVRNSPSAETFLAIEDEAKKYNLPVAAHAPPMDLAVASNGGLTSIEHTETVAVAMRNQDLQTVAKSFVQNKTWYTPTLVIGVNWRLEPKEKLYELIGDTEGKIDERNRYMPLAILQDWKNQLEMQKNEGSYDWAAQTRKGMSEFRQMQAAGVGVLAGTDFGTVLIYPGFSLHDELEALVKEGGLSPFEALQAATKNPAYFFNMQNELGTIETGKIADLVLLTANPLENISNTKKISSVILNGKLLNELDLELLKETTKEQIQKENNSQKNK